MGGGWVEAARLLGEENGERQRQREEEGKRGRKREEDWR